MLLTISVILNILVLSFVGGAFARRLGLIEGKKPVAAKERLSDVRPSVAWPKRDGKNPVISFEQVKDKAETHPQAQRFAVEAERNERAYSWNYSLHYRPIDSSFFYLAELAAEQCDCEGKPFGKTGLRLFLNPYEGEVFFVNTLKDAPPALAAKE